MQNSNIQCGGGYVKLYGADFDQDGYNENTRYLLMFGPDKCNRKSSVSFVLQTQNPKSHEWKEHELVHAPKAPYDNLTHVYTLVLTEDDQFRVKIDNRVVSQGDLHDKNLFRPPFTPEKTIPDPEDKKPEHWVDESTIPDPTDVKPAEWDEDEPEWIVDPYAQKPAEWKEEAPLVVPNYSSAPPKYWDTEKDGEWEMTMTENTDCLKHGCGVWKAPNVKNPRFRGKYERRRIPNPDYIGPWHPRQIRNSNYFTAENIHSVGIIRGIGIDIRVDAPDVLFDSIYVGDS